MTQMPHDPIEIASALCNAGNDFEAYDNGSAKPEFWARVANLVLSWREAWGEPRLRPTSEKPSVGGWIAYPMNYENKSYWNVCKWHSTSDFGSAAKGWILLEEPPRKSMKERAFELLHRKIGCTEENLCWQEDVNIFLREIAEAPSDGPSST